MAETEILDAIPVDEFREAAVDTHSATPHGTPCSACGCPVEPGDRFCPACGSPSEEEAAPARQETLHQRHFRCDNCGAEVATDPDQRSYVCPFCDSTFVVEFSPEATDRQAPEFVIGFAVTPDQALEKFRAWIRENTWFRPGDLRTKMVTDKLKGVYLPFWSFSMLAESRWSADVGEYWYRTETYTTTNSKGKRVTRTRRVRETEWWPLSGNHHHYYSSYLVSGSRGLKQQDAERIKPFQLPSLKRYEPYFLAGWLCEEYSVERDQALSVCQQEFYQREQHNTAAFLPGDTHRSLEVSTTFRNINSDLCLLPIYIVSYKYKDRLYRFLMNGQTGRFSGDKPVSWRRIGLSVGAILLVLVFLFLFIAWLGQHV